MASLHNMLMAGTVVGDDRIEVKSSFFGLCKTAVYQPTGSKLTAVILEFPQDRAGELNRIMQTPDEELPSVVQETGKLVEKSLGNVRLEALVSADKQFAAAQLFRYNDLMFHPDGNIRYFEGRAAEAFSGLF